MKVQASCMHLKSNLVLYIRKNICF